MRPPITTSSHCGNLVPVKMSGEKARVLLLAIQLQEDPQRLRRQMGNGIARGLFQFELGGGVKGVLRHEATTKYAHNLASIREVPASPQAVYEAIEFDDVLAAGLARLLLWSDSKPLPEVGEVREAFDTYLRVWRPGAYTNGTPVKQLALWTKWQLNYARAMDQLRVKA